MNLSKRQLEEIDFFSKEASTPFQPTKTEIMEYINDTVYGIRAKGSNRLLISKRQFDITIPMWREDLVNGLISIDELREDYDKYPFGKRLLDSIIKSLRFKNWSPNKGSIVLTFYNHLKQQEL